MHRRAMDDYWDSMFGKNFTVYNTNMSKKPTLIVETINQIYSLDWDNFVMEIYGKPYYFQQQDECRERGNYYIGIIPDDREEVETWEDEYENDSIPFEVNGDVMGVTFETWLNTSPEDTRKYFDSDSENDLFWQRNFYPDINMIVKDLYLKGLLEPGNYQITVDW